MVVEKGATTPSGRVGYGTMDDFLLGLFLGRNLAEKDSEEKPRQKNFNKEFPTNGKMKDDVRFLRLWDLYSPLLTKTQREITDLYFNYDLSLGEIAEQKGVSRQSVSDCLKKCRKQLEEYEEALGIHELLKKGDRAFSAYMTAVSRWVTEQKKTLPFWEEELCELENTLNSVLTEYDVEIVKE